MIISYKYMHHVALIVSFSSACLSLGMEQTAIIMHLPKEMQVHIYSLIDDPKTQDHLRGTCKDWKEIGDKLTAHSGLLRLLHSLPDSNKETKTRILFYAIYNEDYNLTERILKNMSYEQLYFKNPLDYGHRVLDPYHIAQCKNNKNILDLLKKYNYDVPHYGADQYGQAIESSHWPEDPVEQKLLITSISGDNIGFEKTLHTNFNQKNVPCIFSFGKKNPNLSKSINIQKSFYIIIDNDDVLCTEPCIEWIKNNRSFDFFLYLTLDRALKKRCTKVFTKILEGMTTKIFEKPSDINEIYIHNINGIDQEKTLKNLLLDKSSFDKSPGEEMIPQAYYDVARDILNLFGAKTVEELNQEKDIIITSQTPQW